MDELLRQAITILRGMWHRRWIGLAVAWVIAIVGAVVVYQIEDRYSASARIYVDTESLLGPLVQGLAIAPNINQQVAMLTRTLISRPNIEKLLRTSDMDLLATTQAEKDQLIDNLMRSIRLSGAGGNLYNISYWDATPERAQRVVQNFVSMFVESGLGNKRRDTETARRFIDEQIKHYEARINEAEARMKDFRMENLALLGGGTDYGYLAQVSALNQELNRVQLELRSAEQSRDALKQQLTEELPSLPADLQPRAPTSITPQLDARIESQKAQVDDMMRRYTDQHPDIRAAQRLIAQLEAERKKITDEYLKKQTGESSAGAPTNPVFQQIKVALSEAEANVASLQGRAAELKARIERVSDAAKRRPEVELQMNQMNRDYTVMRRNYDALISRREQAAIGEEITASGAGVEFRLIEPPRASPKPVYPDRLRLVGMVLLLAVGGGLVASFAYAQVFPTVSDARMLRQVGNRPVLGSVSMLISGPMLRRRRLGHAAFGSAVVCLIAFYGAWTAWIGLVMNR